jgi:hypothetical protein
MSLSASFIETKALEFHGKYKWRQDTFLACYSIKTSQVVAVIM